ncbi:MAG: hypothetical protein K0S81_815, partial [Rhodospirillales bacterium]|nr:hypothetical protein [Rhodospirillales bacterium]
MNSKLLASAALVTVLAAASPAQAEGLYIGAFGGANFADEADGTGDVGGGYGYTVEVENELGWAAGAAVGYGFDISLRAEAEVAYRMNELDQANIAIAALDLDGDTTALSIMGNLWFDIPLNGPVRPFLGGGLGMAQVGLNDVEVPAIGPGTF